MFLSTCKSCCCRWKTRKKAKNQPTNQTNKKNTAPKIVTNVYSPVRIIGQTRKKFQTFFPSSHSDVSGVASWSPRDGGPKAGMRNAEGACSMWMPVWPQMDLEWLVPCCLLEPTKVWILAGLPRGNPIELYPNAVEPLVCNRFPNTLGSKCPWDWGFQHRHLS